MKSSHRTPITLITGALGSGKATELKPFRQEKTALVFIGDLKSQEMKSLANSEMRVIRRPCPTNFWKTSPRQHRFSSLGNDPRRNIHRRSGCHHERHGGRAQAIEPRERRALRLEDDELDLLLFNFLQELIYYKDAEKLMLRVNQARVQGGAKPYVLEAIAHGETLDPERHHPRVDVKAVTLHRFRLEKTERGWRASVILDI